MTSQRCKRNSRKKPISASGPNHLVADMRLADFGRKEIEIAETEMPGLMTLRREFGKAQPLKGARISGSFIVAYIVRPVPPPVR